MACLFFQGTSLSRSERDRSMPFVLVITISHSGENFLKCLNILSFYPNSKCRLKKTGSENFFPLFGRKGYAAAVEGLDSPCKLRNHPQRLAIRSLIRARFALAGIPWGKGWKVIGAPMIQRHRGSTIVLGDRMELCSSPSSNPLTPHQPVVFAARSSSAVLELGNDRGLTGSALVAEERVQLGDRGLLGANVVICDTDFRPIAPWKRRLALLKGVDRPALVEGDVFMAPQALILKGVRIGQGAAVGARAVVTRDVRPGDIVAGNPARPVGRARTDGRLS